MQQRAEVKFWAFTRDVLISWEAEDALPENEWTELAPGTLYAHVTKRELWELTREQAGWTTHCRPCAAGWLFEFDLRAPHERVALLLHVILPPFCRVTRVVLSDSTGPGPPGRPYYARVAGDRLALTFFGVGLLYVELFYRHVGECEWEPRPAALLPGRPTWGVVGRAVRDWTTDVAAKLISELISP